MSSKTQRRKERHEQRRKEKRKKQAQQHQQEQARQQGYQRQAEVALSSNTHHRQRVLQQVPHAWPGEPPEDVAIFDDAVLATLSPEVGQEVTAVRDALQCTSKSNADDALKLVSAIPRSSPLSEWRLFIRGLVDWLGGNTDAASEAWKRLDVERRAGRIATVMMLSLRSNLPSLSHPQREGSPEQLPEVEPNGASQASPWDRFDAQQLYHGKLLRRVRFDRTALHAAEAGLKIPDESRDMTLGPRKIQWLRRFIAEYEETEPNLTHALAQAALGRAFCQNYSDLFEDAVRQFRGPRHDPHNWLLKFFYYSRFGEDPLSESVTDKAFEEYLNRDLPNNEALSLPLRNAIASQIHLYEAQSMIRPRGMGIMSIFFGAPEDPREIRDHLRAAAKAYPGNSAAYKTHLDWITDRLENDRLEKADRIKLQNELPVVMRNWSKGVPDEIEPRLWLVDDFLESDELEEARPHVEYLAATRHDDPRVRALPWKWQLLEAMRLCRRKVWLAEVPARLDEAEALWPAWLPKQWLPYLRTALMVRTHQTEQYDEQRRQICETSGLVRDSLPDACMMLGAAQRLRATPAELQPFRAIVDQALKQLGTVPLNDLIQTGAFFWDLHRAQLLYPAYRMHSKDIGKALFARIDKSPQEIVDQIEVEAVQKAIYWGSEHRYWPKNYEAKLPRFFSDAKIRNHFVIRAATTNAELQERHHWGAEKLKALSPRLRDDAKSQRDVYYRYWFNHLADRLDDVIAEEASRFRFPFGNMFGSNAAGHDDNDT